MTIGVPKEVKSQEHRVGMIPASAGELVKRGHRVVVETGAGTDSSYLNAEYEAAGAEIAPTAAAVFQEAELIVKVKEPQPAEVAMLGEKHTLFTYLHLAADKALAEALTASGCTAIAYETLEVGGRLPLLEPMSELAGRMAAIIGSYHLANHRGGRGILLGGVPGVAPGRVMVIGGGTAGVNAARVATGIGADVTIVEVDVERMRFLDIALQEARTLYSTEANITSLLPRIDLIIGAVLIPGAAAPKLITREMLKQMAPGSVLVDIAIDQGGCAETSRPTTHDNPTYFEEDILHYCVANMPGAVPRTSTFALTNATLPWIKKLAALGPARAVAEDAALASAANTLGGKLTCQPVADAFGMECTAPADMASAIQ
ncbi:MAG: alanine dehydrogenase [Roseibacillus sp.]|nr:alanine dehydrogenase [Roseibacillus sp.]